MKHLLKTKNQSEALKELRKLRKQYTKDEVWMIKYKEHDKSSTFNCGLTTFYEIILDK